MKRSNLNVSRTSILFYKDILPKDSSLYRIFNCEEAVNTFDMLDQVINFIPLSPQEIKELRDHPKAKKSYSIFINIQTKQETSICTYLNYLNEKPKIKRKTRKILIDGVYYIFPPLPHQEDKVKKFKIEKWMYPFYQEITEPLFSVNCQTFCDLIKFDGIQVGNILNLVLENGKYLNIGNILNTEILCHILKMIINDY
jgi:hypothetical protein